MLKANSSKSGCQRKARGFRTTDGKTGRKRRVVRSRSDRCKGRRHSWARTVLGELLRAREGSDRSKETRQRVGKAHAQIASMSRPGFHTKRAVPDVRCGESVTRDSRVQPKEQRLRTFICRRLTGVSASMEERMALTAGSGRKRLGVRERGEEREGRSSTHKRKPAGG